METGAGQTRQMHVNPKMSGPNQVYDPQRALWSRAMLQLDESKATERQPEKSQFFDSAADEEQLMGHSWVRTGSTGHRSGITGIWGPSARCKHATTSIFLEGSSRKASQGSEVTHH